MGQHSAAEGSPGGALILKDLVFAVLLLAAAAVAAELLYALVGLTRLSILFLAAVAVTAALRGGRAALPAAFVGVIFYRLFLELRTDETGIVYEDLLNAALFLTVALVTGTLAGRVRDEAEKSERRARALESLLELSRALGDITHEESLWSAAAASISEATRGSPSCLLDEHGELKAQFGEISPGATDLARNLLRNQQLIYVRNGWEARLLWHANQLVGCAAWQTQLEDKGEVADDPVALVLELIAAALARVRASKERAELENAAEASRLREALLSSISHDFRSPLSAIIGSASSLIEYGEKFDQDTRRDLLHNIQEEGEKLNSFVGSLLSMIKLQSGVLTVNLERTAVLQIAEAAVGRVEKHRGKALDVDFEGGCDGKADPLLLEQALYNIIDNAAKYSEAEKNLEISSALKDGHCVLRIADRGPGLPDTEFACAFDKFHFARNRKSRNEGTGLGMSIARGFVEAMGGTIAAKSRMDGRSGLEVIIKLPGADAND